MPSAPGAVQEILPDPQSKRSLITGGRSRTPGKALPLNLGTGDLWQRPDQENRTPLPIAGSQAPSKQGFLLPKEGRGGELDCLSDISAKTRPRVVVGTLRWTQWYTKGRHGNNKVQVHISARPDRFGPRTHQ